LDIPIEYFVVLQEKPLATVASPEERGRIRERNHWSSPPKEIWKRSLEENDFSKSRKKIFKSSDL